MEEIPPSEEDQFLEDAEEEGENVYHFTSLLSNLGFQIIQQFVFYSRFYSCYFLFTFSI